MNPTDAVKTWKGVRNEYLGIAQLFEEEDDPS